MKFFTLAIIGLFVLGTNMSHAQVTENASNVTSTVPPTIAPTSQAHDNTTTVPTTTTISPNSTTSTTTTTEKPTTTTAPSTTTPNSTTTTEKPTTSTVPPTTSTAPNTTIVPTTPSPDPNPSPRHWSTTSFIGGMVFAFGMGAIGFVAWKFYKARNERNYHTL